MFYEYNGTCDINLPALYETFEELHENWRKGEWKECSCKMSEEVEIFSTYGWDGFYMPGKACRHCKCIVYPISSEDFFESEIDGVPDWNPFTDEFFDSIPDEPPFTSEENL